MITDSDSNKEFHNALGALSPCDLHKWTETSRARIALSRFLAGPIPVRKCLSSFVSVTIRVKDFKRDLHSFFENREGMYVHKTFVDELLSRASAHVMMQDTTVSYAPVVQEGYDTELMAEMPTSCLFGSLESFLLFLSFLIERQWGGEKGHLHVNGLATVFYVTMNCEILVVHVYYDKNRWELYVNEPDDNEWEEGTRVYSRAVSS